MTQEEIDELLMNIDKCFGLEKEDFKLDDEGKKVPIFTKWGTGPDQIDIENLKNHSLKISKNLGDVYIDKLHTYKWIVVGEGTTLHCDDITVGEELVENFTGFLM